jgi:hypothetical protein
MAKLHPRQLHLLVRYPGTERGEQWDAENLNDRLGVLKPGRKGARGFFPSIKKRGVASSAPPAELTCTSRISWRSCARSGGESPRASGGWQAQDLQQAQAAALPGGVQHLGDRRLETEMAALLRTFT